MFNYKNKRKRFGTINMTKEIEETILNDTEQMEKLYEEIDNLKIVINNKDLEIKLLKEKNEAYILQIETLKELIKDNIIEHDNDASEGSISEGSEEEIVDIIRGDHFIAEYKIEQYNKKLKQSKDVDNVEDLKIKEVNEEKIYPTPSDSIDSNNKEENDNIIRPNKVSLNNCLYNYYKNKKNKTKLNSGCGKGYRRDRDKTLPPIQRYPPKIYNYSNTKNTELLNFISSENKILIKFQSMIAEKIIEENVWEDIYQFKIINKELKDSPTAKNRFKRKILRSKILYDEYEEKLSKFEIYLSHLGEMSDDDWELWLKGFDKIFIDTYKDIEGCLYVFKTGIKEGKRCGVNNCRNKRHINK